MSTPNDQPTIEPPRPTWWGTLLWVLLPVLVIVYVILLAPLALPAALILGALGMFIGLRRIAKQGPTAGPIILVVVNALVVSMSVLALINPA
ncbi:hypothetical protein D9V34_03880 [Mycetocola lacteus]|uniref:Uncharacterized protein n=1 Tax=Mycetocola lacteus TaxID=76637 RepID=A0A3L7ATW0_9MICO|nr:hypothetical protein [Mycetocola lacteus]RLP83949.1 hypothetical protein D9V34_03880 [Mycetocola lacteus]